MSSLTDSPVTFWNNLSVLDRQIIQALANDPGLTCKGLGRVLNIQDNDYGLSIAPARRLMALRRWGIVQDVEDRCGHCGRAARKQRNVPLFLTMQGLDFYAAVRASTAYYNGAAA